MRVLAGPRVDLRPDGIAATVAQSLAGPEGSVIPLGEIGARNLSRLLSAAEVHLIREAMLGTDPGDYAARECGRGRQEDRLIGYVCLGVEADHEPLERRVVAVTDHANLTWRSPLLGPNDDRLGPRFPSMAEVYAPESVAGRVRSGEGMIVTRGVVAGVLDDSSLTDFEAELVPVVIIGAHLGLRVAAAVVPAGPARLSGH